jgi:hypothetical protein
MSASRLWHRILFLCCRNRMSEALEEEMRLQIELRAQWLLQQGLSSHDAIYAAQRQFGNTSLLKAYSLLLSCSRGSADPEFLRRASME